MTMIVRSTLFALHVLPCSLSAQPILTHPGPASAVLGSTVHLATTPGSFTFTPGPGQIWNALSVQLSLVGTASFGPAAGPYAADHPTADRMLRLIAPQLGTDEHTFLRTTDEAISIVATRVPSAPRNYADPEDLVQFPMHLGDLFTDTYQYDGPDQVTWTYSGYGTLISTAGIHGDLALMTSNDGQFIVWRTEPLSPLVLSEGNGFLLLDPDDGMSVPFSDGESPSFTFRHDPDHNHLQITAGGTGGQWTLVDALGRVVSTGRSAPQTSTYISLVHLPAGMFVATMTHSRGTTSFRFLHP